MDKENPVKEKSFRFAIYKFQAPNSNFQINPTIGSHRFEELRKAETLRRESFGPVDPVERENKECLTLYLNFLTGSSGMSLIYRSIKTVILLLCVS